MKYFPKPSKAAPGLEPSDHEKHQSAEPCWQGCGTKSATFQSNKEKDIMKGNYFKGCFSQRKVEHFFVNNSSNTEKNIFLASIRSRLVNFLCSALPPRLRWNEMSQKKQKLLNPADNRTLIKT